MALEMGSGRGGLETARERGLGTHARGGLEISPDPRDHGFVLAQTKEEYERLVAEDRRLGRDVKRRMMFDVKLRVRREEKTREVRYEIAGRWDRSPDGDLSPARRPRWKPFVPGVVVGEVARPTPEVVARAVAALTADNVVETRAAYRRLKDGTRRTYEREAARMREQWPDSGALGPLFVVKGLYESGALASTSYYKMKTAMMHQIIAEAHDVLDRHPKAGRALYEALKEEERLILVRSAMAVTAFPPDPGLKRLDAYKTRVVSGDGLDDPTFPRFAEPHRRVKQMETSAKLGALESLLKEAPDFYARFWTGATIHAPEEHLPWIAAMMVAGARASELAGPKPVALTPEEKAAPATDGRVRVSLDRDMHGSPLPEDVMSVVITGTKRRRMPDGSVTGMMRHEIMVPLTREALQTGAESAFSRKPVPTVTDGELAPALWLADYARRHGGTVAIDPRKAFGDHKPLRKADREPQPGRDRTNAELAKAMQNLVARVGKKMELESETVTPHVFRHYRESRDKAAGLLTPQELSQLAGHAAEMTTTVYGRAKLGRKGGPVPSVGANGSVTPRPRNRGPGRTMAPRLGR